MPGVREPRHICAGLCVVGMDLEDARDFGSSRGTLVEHSRSTQEKRWHGEVRASLLV